MEDRIRVKDPITAGFGVVDSRPVTVPSSQSPRSVIEAHHPPAGGKDGVGGDILFIRAAAEELIMLSLVHGVDGNIEMRSLPISVDFARVAHAAIGAPVTGATPGEDGTFVDDHECERVGNELGSARIERCEPEAEAAGLAGTAGAGDWNLGQLRYGYH